MALCVTLTCKKQIQADNKSKGMPQTVALNGTKEIEYWKCINADVFSMVRNSARHSSALSLPALFLDTLKTASISCLMRECPLALRRLGFHSASPASRNQRCMHERTAYTSGPRTHSNIYMYNIIIIYWHIEDSDLPVRPQDETPPAGRPIQFSKMWWWTSTKMQKDDEPSSKMKQSSLRCHQIWPWRPSCHKKPWRSRQALEHEASW